MAHLRVHRCQDLRRRKVIGEGQFGKVLRCELSCDNDGEQQPWPSTAQTVAVKVFKNASTETHAYCGRELAMMAGCHHAHVTKVFGICIMEDECPGIVTEYLPGTLLSLLERHAKEASECVPAAPSSTVPYPIICKVGRQITETLHFLHAQKILHRDIKPENILLTDESDVRLCDFGFARSLPPAPQDMTPYVATRWYRAPELLTGQTYDCKVDIWALGCLLWELYTGSPLFPGNTAVDMLLHINAVVDLTGLRAALDAAPAGDAALALPPGGLTPLAVEGMPVDFLMFLRACLQETPGERASAEDLLASRWCGKQGAVEAAAVAVSTPVAPTCSLPTHLQRHYPALRSHTPTSPDESERNAVRAAHPRAASTVSPRHAELRRIRLPSRKPVQLGVDQAAEPSRAAPRQAKREAPRASRARRVLEDSARGSSGDVISLALPPTTGPTGAAADGKGDAQTSQPGAPCAADGPEPAPLACKQSGAQLPQGQHRPRSASTPPAAARGAQDDGQLQLQPAATIAARPASKKAERSDDAPCLAAAQTSRAGRSCSAVAQRGPCAGHKELQVGSAAKRHEQLCAVADPSISQSASTAPSPVTAALLAAQQSEQHVDPARVQHRCSGGTSTVPPPGPPYPALDAAGAPGSGQPAPCAAQGRHRNEPAKQALPAKQACNAAATDRHATVEAHPLSPSAWADLNMLQAWCTQPSLQGAASPLAGLDLLRPPTSRASLEAPPSSQPAACAAPLGAALRAHALAAPRQPSWHDSTAAPQLPPQRSDPGDGVAAFLRSSCAGSLDGALDLAEPFLPEPPIPDAAMWLQGLGRTAAPASADGVSGTALQPGDALLSRGCDGSSVAPQPVQPVAPGGQLVPPGQPSSFVAPGEASEAAWTLAQAAWADSAEAARAKPRRGRAASQRNGDAEPITAAYGGGGPQAADASRGASGCQPSAQRALSADMQLHEGPAQRAAEAVTPVSEALAPFAAEVHAPAACKRFSIKRRGAGTAEQRVLHSPDSDATTPRGAPTSRVPTSTVEARLAQLARSGATPGAPHPSNVPWAARDLAAEFASAPDVRSCALQLEVLRPTRSLGAADLHTVRSAGLKVKAAECVSSPQDVKSPRLAHRRSVDASRSQLGTSLRTAQTAAPGRGPKP